MSTPDDDNDFKMKRIEQANEGILDAWIAYLVGKKQFHKKQHSDYAKCLRFFANNYAARYDDQNLIEGLHGFDSFASDWFIRKCMWSDTKSVRQNYEAFHAFLDYLEETEIVQPLELAEMRKDIEKKLALGLLRVKYYNDPSSDLEDIMDEYGQWDDDYLRSLESPAGDTVVDSIPNQIYINLLFSARATKFFKLKPPPFGQHENMGEIMERSQDPLVDGLALRRVLWHEGY